MGEFHNFPQVRGNDKDIVNSQAFQEKHLMQTILIHEWLNNEFMRILGNNLTMNDALGDWIEFYGKSFADIWDSGERDKEQIETKLYSQK